MELIPRNMTIHIASWKADNGISLFSKALENKEVKVTLSYPLRDNHTFTHLDSSGAGSVTDLIDRIIKEYKYVYSKPRKFGIWGHSIEDLVIEALQLDADNNKIMLYIGS